MNYTEKLTLRELADTVMNTGTVTKTLDVIHNVYYKDNEPPTPNTIVSMMYTDTLRELLELEPDDDYVDRYDIYVTLEEPSDDKPYINIGLLNFKTNEQMSIDLIPWNKLLNLKISSKVAVDIYSLLAHILWEITFYGMTEEDVIKEAKDLERQAKDADNLIEVEWDEVKNELIDKDKTKK